MSNENLDNLSTVPWVVVINAPANSKAHSALLELLAKTQHPIKSLILMGVAAEVAHQDHPIGLKYAACAQEQGCNLLVCGMAAKSFGLQQENLVTGSQLTGFMEILNLMHKADGRAYKVINW